MLDTKSLSVTLPAADIARVSQGKDKKKGNDNEKERGKEGETHVGSPGLSPPPPPAPSPPPPKTPITVRAAAARRAHNFQQAYFSTSAGVETDGTRLLKGVSGKLQQPGAAQELLNILSDRESANISTFEFLSSGCAEQLKAFLLGEPAPLPSQAIMAGVSQSSFVIHHQIVYLQFLPTTSAQDNQLCHEQNCCTGT